MRRVEELGRETAGLQEAIDVTNEVAILRAYALLSQGRYDEAEQMLAGASGALNTPSGADLLARIRFEQGLEDAAQEIWGRIHAVYPEFEPASDALAAFENPPPEPSRSGGRNVLYPIMAGIVLLVGVALALWGLLREPKLMVRVDERVVTNTLERVVEVPVTSFVTSVVERTSVVTNTVTVVKSEVLTNTVEKVIVKEVEKIVYKDPVVVEAREERGSNKRIEVTRKATNEPVPPKQPSNGQQPPRRADRNHDTWIDTAIKGFYTKLGLLPD